MSSFGVVAHSHQNNDISLWHGSCDSNWHSPTIGGATVKTNDVQAKATRIGCLIAVLFVQGCSSVPPATLQPTLSKPEGGIRSSVGVVQSSTGVVGTKSAEVVTPDPSKKKYIPCDRAPASTASTPSISGKDVVKTAVELPVMAVLAPQYVVGAVLAVVVIVPVVAVAAIVKHIGCSRHQPPRPEAHHNNALGVPLRSVALAD